MLFFNVYIQQVIKVFVQFSNISFFVIFFLFWFWSLTLFFISSVRSRKSLSLLYFYVSMFSISSVQFICLSRRSVISRLILSIVACLWMGSSYVGVFSLTFVLILREHKFVLFKLSFCSNSLTLACGSFDSVIF